MWFLIGTRMEVGGGFTWRIFSGIVREIFVQEDPCGGCRENSCAYVEYPRISESTFKMELALCNKSPKNMQILWSSSCTCRRSKELGWILRKNGGVKGYIWRELSSVAEEAAGTMKGGSFPHAAVLLELENAWVFQRCGCYLETIQYIFRRDI